MKTKMPIKWHEDCVSNLRQAVATEEKQVQRIVESLERMKQMLLVAEQQLKEAKRRGLDGYDSDRFLQRRKKS